MKILDVYLHTQLAGKLQQTSTGHLVFTYKQSYLDMNGPPLSLSMPLREQSYLNAIAEPFFSNLLPDYDQRQKLAANLGLSVGNSFALLKNVGRECAGAVALLPHGYVLTDQKIGTTYKVNDKQLKKILLSLPDRPLLSGKAARFKPRLSLAGAQAKLGVFYKNDEIKFCKNGHPTTHIIKPFNSAYPGSSHNELFCMRLARKLGFRVPTVCYGEVEGLPYILIRRYDRLVEPNGTITKLHQEDMCQALGISPHLKYQSEGGPGISAIKAVLTEHAYDPVVDWRDFGHMIMFHYLIGNSDAHAKNFSVLWRDGKVELAPVYDALSTCCYPELDKNMSMSIGGRFRPDKLQLRHWSQLAGHNIAGVHHDLYDLIKTIEPTAQIVLDELSAEGISHPIFEKIMKIIKSRKGLVEQQLNRSTQD